MTTCALCGYSFAAEEEGRSACASCPLHRSCALLRCPNCGYEFPPEKDNSIRKDKTAVRTDRSHDTAGQSSTPLTKFKNLVFNRRSSNVPS